MAFVLSRSLKLSSSPIPRQLPASAALIHPYSAQAVHKPDRKHGSVHWKIERVMATTMVPLITGTFIMGPNMISDVLLGVLLPFHVHMGFDACITDYFNPARANPLVSKIFMYTLHSSSTAAMLGCALFNFNNIGMTELIQRMWLA